MRGTPAQLAVALICGKELAPFVRQQGLTARMRAGRDSLIQMTRQNFGFDLQAWHDYLKESRDGGYTYGRNITLPQIMKEALASATWREAAEHIVQVDAARLERRKKKKGLS